jgi:hypothetical protein
LFVLVAPTDQAATWTRFMDEQADAEMLGIEGGGRLYRMAAAPYAHEIRPGVALQVMGAPAGGGWLTLDLGQSRIVRSLELRTYGNLVQLSKDFVVQTSADNVRWTTAFDERPGGAALAGVLRLPRVIPLLVDLGDVEARYVRVNAPYFRAGAVTIYGP